MQPYINESKYGYASRRHCAECQLPIATFEDFSNDSNNTWYVSIVFRRMSLACRECLGDFAPNGGLGCQSLRLFVCVWWALLYIKGSIIFLYLIMFVSLGRCIFNQCTMCWINAQHFVCLIFFALCTLNQPDSPKNILCSNLYWVNKVSKLLRNLTPTKKIETRRIVSIATFVFQNCI